MSGTSWGAVINQFDRLSRFGTVGGLDESQLLERFLARKDEGAFEAIVERYGPMVLSVCRDLIPDQHDVEDAFQATFLVLVRRAGGLRRREQLGSWLHGVARRVAMRSRAVSCRNRERTRTWEADHEPASDDAPRGVGEELRPLIREEVDRLPARYRDAVVLCYFEGRTHEEAARRLGWPLGTVKGRLARAREQLKVRLERRGVDAAPLSVGLALSTGRATVPALLRTRTVAAALAYLQAGPGTVLTTTIISGAVLELAQGALKSMTFGITKLGLFGAVSVGVLAIPAVLASQATSTSTPTKPATASAGPAPKSQTTEAPTARAPVESSSKTKVTRPAEGGGGGEFTTATATSPTRPRSRPVTPQDLLTEAQAVYVTAEKFHAQGRILTSELIRWSGKIVEAELTTTSDRDGRIRAFENQLIRMKSLAENEARAFQEGKATSFDSQSVRFAESESAAWLQEAKQDQSGLPTAWRSRVVSRNPLQDRDAFPAGSGMMAGAGPGGMKGGIGMGAGGGAGPAPVGGFGGPAPIANGRSIAGGTPGRPVGGMMGGMGGAVALAPTEGAGASGGPPQAVRGSRSSSASVPAGMMSSGGGMMGAVVPDGGMMGGGMSGGAIMTTIPDSDSERLSAAVRKRLDDVVSMNFPNETPLEDVLKYIKSSTSKDKGGLAKGIPIYLDPIGLSEAEKTPASVISLDLEGVPLRTTLRLALDQLGLMYKVHDGVLIISTPERVDQLTQQ